MKPNHILRTVALATVVALTGAFVGASAQERSNSPAKGSITVKYAATIGGHEIEPGKYDVEVTDEPEATLILRRDHKEVARVPVARQTLPFKAPYERVDFKSGEEGGRQVYSIVLKGKAENYLVKDGTGVAKAGNP